MNARETSEKSNKPNWKKIIANLVGMGLITVLLVFLVLGWLNIYTNHGDAFSVPNFEGLTVAESEKLADKKDLRIKVVDSIYSPQGKPGAVIDQNPPPDFKVKKGRRIFVTINSVNPKIIEMPDFIDMTFVQAKANVESYGLQIGKISYKPSKYDNVVLEQSYKGRPIEPGEPIAQFSKVELVLGESENMQNSTTPMVIGLTHAEAQQLINDNNLNVGSVLYDETVVSSTDTLSALVRRQFPVPNVPLSPGEDVDLWMSMLKDTIF